DSLRTLSEGRLVPGGAIALLAPGTGLGEGFLTWENGFYRAHPSEGSHAAFAPVGELQIGLLRYMNAQGFEHVSFERVCSGGLGIPNLYSYLRSLGFEEPQWLKEKLDAAEDPTPVILEAALDQSACCEIAVKTVELFVEILGAEAGNLALKVLATGGIYIAGGISPRILPYLEKPVFLEALRNKGRFRQTLNDIPVHVILDPEAGLRGAAAYGLQVTQGEAQ
ncbi:MAG: glucokinase, partial [Anaerolineae bacterium]